MDHANTHSTTLYHRFIGYSTVGISTYVLDLAILWTLLTFSTVPETWALVIGFLVGVSSNFFLCYYWIYRGTTRSRIVGYSIFVGCATLGVAFVAYTTTYLYETLGLNVYIARTLVAAIIGLINFTINTFFNFRLH
jgi:putative flippase GtrA